MPPASFRSLTARTVSLVLAATALAALTGAAPTAAAPSATARGVAATAPLRIGTYNIRSGESFSEFKAGVTELRPYVDVAGLQEIGANNKNRWLRGQHAWGYCQAPHLQQNPVIWDRSRFDFLGCGERLLARGRTIANGNPGADQVRADSYATLVRLRDRATGQLTSFLNVHLASGAVRGGRKWSGRKALFRMYKEQQASLVEAQAEESTREVGGQYPLVYVLGDFNVGYKADLKWQVKGLPYRSFTHAKLVSNWRDWDLSRKKGTHKDALIDQVWHASPAASSRILTWIKHSDHRPPVATYDLPLVAGFVPVDGTVGFRDTTVSAAECDRIFQKPTLRFTLVGDLAHGYVDAVAEDGTGPDGAKQGKDFTVDTSQLTDEDPTTNEVVVTIIPNKVLGPDKTFTLRLVGPINTDITEGSATGVILDDDTKGDPNCPHP